VAGLETLIRDLRLRRGRERRGLALAEGIRLVEEALAARVPLRHAAVSPALEATPRGAALKTALAAAGVPLVELDDRALAGLADTEHPQGVIAVFEPPSWSLEKLTPRAGEVVVVLDGVQDPGNVGSMLRSAAAAGVARVLLSKHCAFAWSPKVLRAGQGAHFCLDIHEDVDLPAWAQAYRASGAAVVAAVAAGGTSLFTASLAGRVALAVGNEGAGLSAELAAQATQRVTIPMPGGVESLNAAAAAGNAIEEDQGGHHQ